ncbi:hypothetical protein PI172_2003 [Prevotella intermedia]|uniref:Uncharacterized protein n=1 Tax=Prevotella intermedia TaxID=28131 RepID=A0AAD1BL84_PREIN|nr:hypothetical protein PI172_2003 [Prevotella intermedia]
MLFQERYYSRSIVSLPLYEHRTTVITVAKIVIFSERTRKLHKN